MTNNAICCRDSASPAQGFALRHKNGAFLASSRAPPLVHLDNVAVSYEKIAQ